MYLLGLDVGSSSVKASLIDAETGKNIASAFYPKQEMEIQALKPGWAEQHPDLWWGNCKLAVKDVVQNSNIKPEEIKAIGISYQMHGLVIVDKHRKVLRPSIIWCDSRAVETGRKAMQEIGEEKCLSHLLNSPGNFTASKLKWVKDNEPEIYNQIDKIMLPGDYIALKLTGELKTTASGLSEGILWDFKENDTAGFLLDYYGFDPSFIPEIAPSFAKHGELTPQAANELGLKEGIQVSYRAGDQPNNAFSLNVTRPGEIAATAGTSGVVFGVSDEVKYDPHSRVNTFAHVTHTEAQNRLGVLLCVNGTGILNSWLKKNVAAELQYDAMNNLAEGVAIGSDGLSILPFGNGAERLLKGEDVGCSVNNLNFNIHNNAHLFRAAQEGIVFTFKYGIDIMKGIGIEPEIIRAGNANMFLSNIFRTTLASITGATIELYNTDGAQGAARGAGIGAGYYKSVNDAFSGLQKLNTIEPDTANKAKYEEAYNNWLKYLK